VALWDKPDVGLKTNRRVDRIGDKTPKSPWYHRNTAPDAFRSLFARLPVKNILVSYGSDSKIMTSETLLSICQEFGDVTTWAINYKRNIMSSIGNAANNNEKQTKNQELLFLIKR
jgi:adenine-specific DNA methylase